MDPAAFFARMVDQVDWSQQDARFFTEAIQWALTLEDTATAARLAREGHRLFPQHDWLEKATQALNGQASPRALAELLVETQSAQAISVNEAILTVATDAAARYLRVDSPSRVISELLGRLGPAARADHALILREDGALAADGTRPTYGIEEWTAPGVTPFQERVGEDLLSFSDVGLGRWETELQQGNLISTLQRQFPPGERAVLERWGVQALVLLPLWAEQDWLGMLALINTQTAREWPDGEVLALRQAAEIVGAILDHDAFHASLRRSASRYDRLFQQAPDCIIVETADEQIVDANPAASDLFGYSREELLRMRTSDLQPARLRNGPQRLDERFETFVSHRDGTEIPVDISLTPLDSSDDGTTLYMSIVRDITAQQRAQTAITQTASLLRATIESTADAILVIDTNHNVILFNQRLLDMWRLPDDWTYLPVPSERMALIAQNVQDRAGYERRLAELLADFGTEGYDRLRTVDGRIIERRARPYRVEDQVAGRLFIYTDVTERVRMEEILREQERQHFAELSDLKDEFVYTVSHDLKAPIGIIVGYGSLLKASPTITDPQDREFVEQIERAALQMNTLVTELLDLARIERGGAIEELKPVSIHNLLRVCVEPFRLVAKEKDVTLDYDRPEPDITAHLDSGGMSQVVNNLVSNAIKYTPEGGKVSVSAATTGEDVIITVRDTGLGIPESDLPHLFEKFYRVKSKKHLKSKGTGLGLAIAKAIVEQHHGTITVESQVDVGTTFMIRLPLGGPPGPAPDDPPSAT